jgi:hypothetical protein
MFALYLVFFFLYMPCLLIGQSRSIISSGGLYAKSNNAALHGTIGQPATGILLNQSNDYKKAGFWHGSVYLPIRSNPNVYIIMPDCKAAPGQLFTMTIKIKFHGIYTHDFYWSLKYNFNATILEPDSGFNSYIRTGQTGLVEIKGFGRKDTVVNITFRAKLGNASESVLQVYSFTTYGIKMFPFTAKQGSFVLDDSCIDNNGNGMVMMGQNTLSVFYSFASQCISISCGVESAGDIILKIYDIQGKLIRTEILYADQKGIYQFLYPVDLSGIYAVQMLYKNELLTQLCQVMQ